MCLHHNSACRPTSGSLICEFSGTCIGALRDMPHETPAWHQAQAEEMTTQPGAAVCLGGARAGGRSSSRAAGCKRSRWLKGMTPPAGGCMKEQSTWRRKRRRVRVGGGKQAAATEGGWLHEGAERKGGREPPLHRGSRPCFGGGNQGAERERHANDGAARGAVGRRRVECPPRAPRAAVLLNLAGVKGNNRMSVSQRKTRPAGACYSTRRQHSPQRLCHGDDHHSPLCGRAKREKGPAFCFLFY